ncbi:hypothetical protein ASD24_18140 [Paenibacillus sp. Root52]|nr:hypothetical protein ASD24_18140 [Paenibacillus sp. Root52]
MHFYENVVDKGRSEEAKLMLSVRKLFRKELGWDCSGLYNLHDPKLHNFFTPITKSAEPICRSGAFAFIPGFSPLEKGIRKIWG